nr:MAG TPA: hypothetical protein [Caudoviricetes sp.]
MLSKKSLELLETLKAELTTASRKTKPMFKNNSDM